MDIKIKFTTTYTQINTDNRQFLYYTVEDSDGNLKDISDIQALNAIQHISNASDNDIKQHKIIGYHVDLKGTLLHFSPNCVRKVIYGYNDFETYCLKCNRLLLEEYNDSYDVKTISHGMLIDIKWKCKVCGNEFTQVMKNRVHKGYKCTKCSKQGDSFPQFFLYNILLIQYPDALYKYHYKKDKRYEIDILIPSINLGIEYDGTFHNSDESIERDKRKEIEIKQLGINLLRVKESKEELMSDNLILYNRDIQCNNLYKAIYIWFRNHFNIELRPVDFTKLSADYTTKKPSSSLLYEYPNIVKTWDYELNKITPDYVSPKSTRFAFFKCDKCGISLYRKVLHVTQRGDKVRCPVCNGKVIVPGINDFKTLQPKLMQIWDYKMNSAIGIEPNQISKTSHKECYWTCNNCGETWMLSIPSMLSRKFCNKCKKYLYTD